MSKREYVAPPDCPDAAWLVTWRHSMPGSSWIAGQGGAAPRLPPVDSPRRCFQPKETWARHLAPPGARQVPERGAARGFPFPRALFYGGGMTGIVIIGGAAEAHDLARALPGAHVRLPTRERVARRWPGAVSVGPVTADWLRERGARVVVEAAHPCDVATAFAVARAARAAGVPVLQLVRPEWRPTRRDRWVSLRDARAAVGVIPAGARVLVATGRAALPGLRALRAHVLMRRIGGGGGFAARQPRRELFICNAFDMCYYIINILITIKNMLFLSENLLNKC